MSKLLKIGLTLLVLVLALLVLAVIRIATLDPNDYKDWISARFEEQTGQVLSLDGQISLTLYPWLGLGVDQVSIANRPGFGAQPLLQAQSAQVRVRLLPLLRQHYEIDTIRLQGISLNLVVNQDGETNWAGLAGESAPAAETGSGDGAGLPLTRLVVGGVDVSDVSLRYEDQRSGVFYLVDNLAFTVGELVYGTPIALSLTLDGATNQPELQAGVALSGTLNYDLDNERYAVDPLTLSAQLSGPTLPAGGATVELATTLDVDLAADTLNIPELQVTGLDASLVASLQGNSISTPAPAYQGQLNISGDDLADLFQAAGVAELAGRLQQLADRRFTLQASGGFRGGTRGGMEIPTLTASLLGANLDASLTVTNVNAGSPDARGQLNASGPDLPLVVEVLGQLSGGGNALLSRASREMRQVPERGFDIDLGFSTTGGGSAVTVPTLQASLLGASLNGELQAADIDTETPRVSGRLEAEGPDLPLLLQLGGLIQAGSDAPLYQVASRLRGDANSAFQVTTRFDVDLESGNIEVPQLTARSLGWTLEGQVDARQMSERNGSVAGSLTLDSSNAGPLLVALEQSELAEVVRQVSANLSVSGNRTDLAVSPLNASVVVAGPRIAGSPATLNLGTSARVNLDRESLSLQSFTVNGLGLNLTGNLDVERLFEDPAYQGQVQLAEFNLRSFLQQLNLPLPDTRDSQVLQRVALNARIDGASDRLALEGLDLVMDETSLRGNVSIASFTAPGGEFSLEIDRLDADRYLAPEGSAPSPAAQPAATELPVDSLRNLSLSGDLQVGELTVAGLNLQSIAVTVNAIDGELNLAPLAAALYQGSFEGAVGLSVSGAEPVGSLQADLRGIDLELLLSDLLDADSTYLTGTGNVQLALRGTGADTDAMKQTLNGDGRLAVEDGVLSGVDVASVLTQLETMIRSRQPAGLQRGTQTAFDSFSGTVAVNSGVVSSNDILIQSPGFRISGQGTLLNLADNSIDFNLTTTVDSATATRADQEYDIGGYSLPIACSGSLEAPRCIPDAGEILRARVQRAVQDRVLDLLNRSGGADNGATSQQQSTPETQQAEPEQSAEPQPEPAQQSQQEPAQQPQQEPTDIREQIINRALDRLLN